MRLRILYSLRTHFFYRYTEQFSFLFCYKKRSNIFYYTIELYQVSRIVTLLVLVLGNFMLCWQLNSTIFSSPAWKFKGGKHAKWPDCSRVRIIRVTSSNGSRNVLAEVGIHRWLAASYMEYRVPFESSARMSRKRRRRRGTSPFKAYTEADKRFDIVYKAPNTTSGLLVDASKGLATGILRLLRRYAAPCMEKLQQGSFSCSACAGKPLVLKRIFIICRMSLNQRNEIQSKNYSSGRRGRNSSSAGARTMFGKGVSLVARSTANSRFLIARA